MKINNLGLQQVNPYKKQLQKAEAAKNEKASFNDQLSISSAAKEMQSSPVSAERAERVKQLKLDVESGKYNVDLPQVAQNMVNFYRK